MIKKNKERNKEQRKAPKLSSLTDCVVAVPANFREKKYFHSAPILNRSK